ncbi:hypothetical protein Bbelb_234820 [Branchiostoma belcheri]|nr:hypothetical protein Bbelb_234820 [Branchiostoma belcheri]
MGGCPAIRPKCRWPSLTGDTSERARLEYGPQRRPCAGGEKMGGCPAIRPKCRRPSLTGDTSERARLGVRASTTALRRRGKDGRGPTWSTGLNDGLAPAGKRWEGARRLGLSVDGHLRPGTHRRGPDLKYGPQRRPCAGGEKMGGCPAIRPKCRRSSQTGDTSERGPDLEYRVSRRPSAGGNTEGTRRFRSKCRRPSLTGDTSERARTWSTGLTDDLAPGGKHRRRRGETSEGTRRFRSKCRRPSLTGDTSERARTWSTGSHRRPMRRGDNIGAAPTNQPGCRLGVASPIETLSPHGLETWQHCSPGPYCRSFELWRHRSRQVVGPSDWRLSRGPPISAPRTWPALWPYGRRAGRGVACSAGPLRCARGKERATPRRRSCAAERLSGHES